MQISLTPNSDFFCFLSPSVHQVFTQAATNTGGKREKKRIAVVGEITVKGFTPLVKNLVLNSSYKKRYQENSHSNISTGVVITANDGFVETQSLVNYTVTIKHHI